MGTVNPTDEIDCKAGGECDPVYLGLELIGTQVPMLIFALLGFVRFRNIRSIGFNRVTEFSKFFQFKRALCFILAFMNFLTLVVTIAAPKALVDDPNACNYELCMNWFNESTGTEWEIKLYLSFFNSLSCIVWIFSERLLVYEYRKGLSEGWYSHKLYWILFTLVNLASFIYCMINNYYTTFMVVMRALTMLCSFTLFVMMVRTKGRSADKLRPTKFFAENG